MGLSRAACSILAAGCLLWLDNGPALSRGQGERAEVIISKLRTTSLPAYRALRVFAGNSPIQVLPLTKMEVWTVPRNRVAGLKRVASRFGMRVNEFAPDWNHVLRPVPAPTTLGDVNKTERLQANTPGAPAEMSMALPPRAAMLEYALTKGSPDKASKIVVRLNEATVLTLTRTSVEVGTDMCTWHGIVDGTDAPATIMWWPGVAMAGVMRHDGRLYSIRRMRGGVRTVAVVETTEDRMPPEHAPTPSRFRTNDPNVRDDPLVRTGDASEMRTTIARERKATTPASTEITNSAQTDVAINVIVAYTQKAASYYTDPSRELVAFSIELANQSFRNSKLENIKLQLVHSYQTDYVEEGQHFDHLWRFADRDDGYLDEIHPLREKYDADVAILIVDDPTGCGLATRVFADADEAFAVVHHACALMSYSVAHEIGHLIGARHELQIDGTMTPFPYGHGFVNGMKWRDIMSYKASCNGCPRLPIWSNPNVFVKGDRAGSLNEDNARVIAEQAARLTYFRASRRNQLLSSAPVPDTGNAGAADQ
jgi:metallopeptidase family M12-like protein